MRFPHLAKINFPSEHNTELKGRPQHKHSYSYTDRESTLSSNEQFLNTALTERPDFLQTDRNLLHLEPAAPHFSYTDRSDNQEWNTNSNKSQLSQSNKSPAMTSRSTGGRGLKSPHLRRAPSGSFTDRFTHQSQPSDSLRLLENIRNKYRLEDIIDSHGSFIKRVDGLREQFPSYDYKQLTERIKFDHEGHSPYGANTDRMIQNTPRTTYMESLHDPSQSGYLTERRMERLRDSTLSNVPTTPVRGQRRDSTEKSNGLVSNRVAEAYQRIYNEDPETETFYDKSETPIERIPIFEESAIQFPQTKQRENNSRNEFFNTDTKVQRPKSFLGKDWEIHSEEIKKKKSSESTPINEVKEFESGTGGYVSNGNVDLPSEVQLKKPGMLPKKAEKALATPEKSIINQGFQTPIIESEGQNPQRREYNPPKGRPQSDFDATKYLLDNRGPQTERSQGEDQIGTENSNIKNRIEGLRSKLVNSRTGSSKSIQLAKSPENEKSSQPSGADKQLLWSSEKSPQENLKGTEGRKSEQTSNDPFKIPIYNKTISNVLKKQEDSPWSMNPIEENGDKTQRFLNNTDLFSQNQSDEVKVFIEDLNEEPLEEDAQIIQNFGGRDSSEKAGGLGEKSSRETRNKGEVESRDQSIGFGAIKKSEAPKHSQRVDRQDLMKAENNQATGYKSDLQNPEKLQSTLNHEGNPNQLKRTLLKSSLEDPKGVQLAQTESITPTTKAQIIPVNNFVGSVDEKVLGHKPLDKAQKHNAVETARNEGGKGVDKEEKTPKTDRSEGKGFDYPKSSSKIGKFSEDLLSEFNPTQNKNQTPDKRRNEISARDKETPNNEISGSDLRIAQSPRNEEQHLNDQQNINKGGKMECSPLMKEEYGNKGDPRNRECDVFDLKNNLRHQTQKEGIDGGKKQPNEMNQSEKFQSKISLNKENSPVLSQNYDSEKVLEDEPIKAQIKSNQPIADSPNTNLQNLASDKFRKPQTSSRETGKKLDEFTGPEISKAQNPQNLSGTDNLQRIEGLPPTSHGGRKEEDKGGPSIDPENKRGAQSRLDNGSPDYERPEKVRELAGRATGKRETPDSVKNDEDINNVPVKKEHGSTTHIIEKNPRQNSFSKERRETNLVTFGEAENDKWSRSYDSNEMAEIDSSRDDRGFSDDTMEQNDFRKDKYNLGEAFETPKEMRETSNKSDAPQYHSKKEKGFSGFNVKPETSDNDFKITETNGPQRQHSSNSQKSHATGNQLPKEGIKDRKVIDCSKGKPLANDSIKDSQPNSDADFEENNEDDGESQPPQKTTSENLGSKSQKGIANLSKGQPTHSDRQKNSMPNDNSAIDQGDTKEKSRETDGTATKSKYDTAKESKETNLVPIEGRDRSESGHDVESVEREEFYAPKTKFNHPNESQRHEDPRRSSRSNYGESLENLSDISPIEQREVKDSSARISDAKISKSRQSSVGQQINNDLENTKLTESSRPGASSQKEGDTIGKQLPKDERRDVKATNLPEKKQHKQTEYPGTHHNSEILESSLVYSEKENGDDSKSSLPNLKSKGSEQIMPENKFTIDSEPAPKSAEITGKIAKSDPTTTNDLTKEQAKKNLTPFEEQGRDKYGRLEHPSETAEKDDPILRKTQPSEQANTQNLREHFEKAPENFNKEGKPLHEEVVSKKQQLQAKASGADKDGSEESNGAMPYEGQISSNDLKSNEPSESSREVSKSQLDGDAFDRQSSKDPMRGSKAVNYSTEEKQPEREVMKPNRSKGMLAESEFNNSQGGSAKNDSKLSSDSEQTSGDPNPNSESGISNVPHRKTQIPEQPDEKIEKNKSLKGDIDARSNSERNQQDPRIQLPEQDEKIFMSDFDSDSENKQNDGSPKTKNNIVQNLPSRETGVTGVRPDEQRGSQSLENQSLSSQNTHGASSLANSAEGGVSQHDSSRGNSKINSSEYRNMPTEDFKTHKTPYEKEANDIKRNDDKERDPSMDEAYGEKIGPVSRDTKDAKNNSIRKSSNQQDHDKSIPDTMPFGPIDQDTTKQNANSKEEKEEEHKAPTISNSLAPSKHGSILEEKIPSGLDESTGLVLNKRNELGSNSAVSSLENPANERAKNIGGSNQSHKTNKTISKLERSKDELHRSSQSESNSDSELSGHAFQSKEGESNNQQRNTDVKPKKVNKTPDNQRIINVNPDHRPESDPIHSQERANEEEEIMISSAPKNNDNDPNKLQHLSKVRNPAAETQLLESSLDTNLNRESKTKNLAEPKQQSSTTFNEENVAGTNEKPNMSRGQEFTGKQITPPSTKSANVKDEEPSKEGLLRSKVSEPVNNQSDVSTVDKTEVTSAIHPGECNDLGESHSNIQKLGSEKAKFQNTLDLQPTLSDPENQNQQQPLVQSSSPGKKNVIVPKLRLNELVHPPLSSNISETHINQNPNKSINNEDAKSKKPISEISQSAAGDPKTNDLVGKFQNTAEKNPSREHFLTDKGSEDKGTSKNETSNRITSKIDALRNRLQSGRPNSEAKQVPNDLNQNTTETDSEAHIHPLDSRPNEKSSEASKYMPTSDEEKFPSEEKSKKEHINHENLSGNPENEGLHEGKHLTPSKIHKLQPTSKSLNNPKQSKQQVEGTDDDSKSEEEKPVTEEEFINYGTHNQNSPTLQEILVEEAAKHESQKQSALNSRCKEVGDAHQVPSSGSHRDEEEMIIDYPETHSKSSSHKSKGLFDDRSKGKKDNKLPSEDHELQQNNLQKIDSRSKETSAPSTDRMSIEKSLPEGRKEMYHTPQVTATFDDLERVSTRQKADSVASKQKDTPRFDPSSGEESKKETYNSIKESNGTRTSIEDQSRFKSNNLRKQEIGFDPRLSHEENDREKNNSQPMSRFSKENHSQTSDREPITQQLDGDDKDNIAAKQIPEKEGGEMRLDSSKIPSGRKENPKSIGSEQGLRDLVSFKGSSKDEGNVLPSGRSSDSRSSQQHKKNDNISSPDRPEENRLDEEIPSVLVLGQKAITFGKEKSEKKGLEAASNNEDPSHPTFVSTAQPDKEELIEPRNQQETPLADFGKRNDHPAKGHSGDPKFAHRHTFGLNPEAISCKIPGTENSSKNNEIDMQKPAVNSKRPTFGDKKFRDEFEEAHPLDNDKKLSNVNESYSESGEQSEHTDDNSEFKNKVLQPETQAPMKMNEGRRSHKNEADNEESKIEFSPEERNTSQEEFNSKLITLKDSIPTSPTHFEKLLGFDTLKSLPESTTKLDSSELKKFGLDPGQLSSSPGSNKRGGVSKHRRQFSSGSHKPLVPGNKAEQRGSEGSSPSRDDSELPGRNVEDSKDPKLLNQPRSSIQKDKVIPTAKRDNQAGSYPNNGQDEKMSSSPDIESQKGEKAQPVVRKEADESPVAKKNNFERSDSRGKGSNLLDSMAGGKKANAALIETCSKQTPVEYLVSPLPESKAAKNTEDATVNKSDDQNANKNGVDAVGLTIPTSGTERPRDSAPNKRMTMTKKNLQIELPTSEESKQEETPKELPKERKYYVPLRDIKPGNLKPNEKSDASQNQTPNAERNTQPRYSSQGSIPFSHSNNESQSKDRSKYDDVSAEELKDEFRDEIEMLDNNLPDHHHYHSNSTFELENEIMTPSFKYPGADPKKANLNFTTSSQTSGFRPIHQQLSPLGLDFNFTLSDQPDQVGKSHQNNPYLAGMSDTANQKSLQNDNSPAHGDGDEGLFDQDSPSARLRQKVMTKTLEKGVPSLLYGYSGKGSAKIFKICYVLEKIFEKRKILFKSQAFAALGQINRHAFRSQSTKMPTSKPSGFYSERGTRVLTPVARTDNSSQQPIPRGRASVVLATEALTLSFVDYSGEAKKGFVSNIKFYWVLDKIIGKKLRQAKGDAWDLIKYVRKTNVKPEIDEEALARFDSVLHFLNSKYMIMTAYAFTQIKLEYLSKCTFTFAKLEFPHYSTQLTGSALLHQRKALGLLIGGKLAEILRNLKRNIWYTLKSIPPSNSLLVNRLAPHRHSQPVPLSKPMIGPQKEKVDVTKNEPLQELLRKILSWKIEDEILLKSRYLTYWKYISDSHKVHLLKNAHHFENLAQNIKKYLFRRLKYNINQSHSTNLEEKLSNYRIGSQQLGLHLLSDYLTSRLRNAFNEIARHASDLSEPKLAAAHKKISVQLFSARYIHNLLNSSYKSFLSESFSKLYQRKLKLSRILQATKIIEVLQRHSLLHAFDTLWRTSYSLSLLKNADTIDSFKEKVKILQRNRLSWAFKKLLEAPQLLCGPDRNSNIICLQQILSHCIARRLFSGLRAIEMESIEKHNKKLAALNLALKLRMLKESRESELKEYAFEMIKLTFEETYSRISTKNYGYTNGLFKLHQIILAAEFRKYRNIVNYLRENEVSIEMGARYLDKLLRNHPRRLVLEAFKVLAELSVDENVQASKIRVNRMVHNVLNNLPVFVRFETLFSKKKKKSMLSFFK